MPMASVVSMSVVECPGCGAVDENVRLQKTATEFCAGCDCPLFWAIRRDQGLGGHGPGSVCSARSEGSDPAASATGADHHNPYTRVPRSSCS